MESVNVFDALDMIANELTSEFEEVRLKAGSNLYLDGLVYSILYKIAEMKDRMAIDGTLTFTANTNSISDELTTARLLIKLQGLTALVVEHLNK